MGLFIVELRPHMHHLIVIEKSIYHVHIAIMNKFIDNVYDSKQRNQYALQIAADLTSNLTKMLF